MSDFDQGPAMEPTPAQESFALGDLRKLECPGCGSTHLLSAGERIACDCHVPPQGMPLWALRIIGGPALERRLTTLAELAAERETFEARWAERSASSANAEGPQLQSRPWMRPSNPC